MNEPVIVRLDKSGRRGKAVTLIERLPLHPDGKVEILKDPNGGAAPGAR